MPTPQFEFVTELPETKLHRDHRLYEKAAHEHPDQWLRLPWPDDASGSLATLYKNYHHCETRTIDHRVYIRALREPSK